MKALETSLAIAAGILIAGFMAALVEPEGWSSSRIIPGLVLRTIAAIGLITGHVPITRLLLGILAVTLLVLVVHEAVAGNRPLAVFLWSATYFAVMLAIHRLRRRETPLLSRSSASETAE